MGMRWYYTLTVHSDNEQEIIDDFRQSCEEANCALDNDGSAATDTSWHNEEKDFKAISRKYPDVLFEVHRDGTANASDDLAYIYYKNGKMQECFAEINYPEFDETKLK